jgi:protein-S-isoprenylcysteine O-methyltransferase Ste14
MPKFKLSRILAPPIWFLLAGLLMLALNRYAPGVRLLSLPWTWLGILPVGVGVALALWAARLFRTRETPIEPWATPSAFIDNGPYRFTRNPMYLGLALGLFGLALCLGSLTPLLVLPPFVWVITVRHIRPEESRLTALFGGEFTAYKARVRRWI